MQPDDPRGTRRTAEPPGGAAARKSGRRRRRQAAKNDSFLPADAQPQGPAACDHRRDSQATYPYNNQSAGKDRRSSEPRGAGPPVRYPSSAIGGRPYDPAASGDAGRCTRKQAGKDRIAWAGAGERRHSRSEPGSHAVLPVLYTIEALFNIIIL